jgi:hypothetical protein
VSVLRVDPSNAQAPQVGAHGRSRSHDRHIVGRKNQHESPVATGSGDALLLALLTLLNESVEMDSALQDSLDMVTAALGGRIGEIWLRTGEARDIELHYSSSDGSAALAAFVAAGRALGVSAGPASISRVVKTGRGSTAASIGRGGWGARAAQAAKADLRAAMTFAIRTNGGVIGVLAVFCETVEPTVSGMLNSIPAACHHIGRFLERVRAEGAFHEAAMELSALASTDSLTGLKNRREFDRSLRTIPRQPFRRPLPGR